MTGVERLDARREFWRAVHVECRTTRRAEKERPWTTQRTSARPNTRCSHISRTSSPRSIACLEKRAAGDADHDRLTRVQVELDQCWDLLRQRRALRETGSDPGRAEIRPPDIVEKYIG